jgi:hypothetical protein
MTEQEIDGLTVGGRIRTMDGERTALVKETHQGRINGADYLSGATVEFDNGDVALIQRFALRTTFEIVS